MIAPALITLTGTLIWTGELEEGGRWLQRAWQARQAETGPDLGLLLHHTTGMLQACRGRHYQALPEFTAADLLQSQLAGSHALASQVTGWLLATQARLGRTAEARAAFAALDDERAGSGEIRNARAAIGLADGDPAAALRAVREVLDGTAPVIGYVTIVEAQLLAGLAHRELGDQGAANEATERALSLAQADRLVLPFAMTSARDLLEALPPQHTGHAALRTDILDVLHGSSPPVRHQDPAPPAEQLSWGELRVLRYLPTNLSRPEIAGELSVSPNTVNTHVRSIYAKLQVRDRSAAVQRARELRLLAVRSPAKPHDHLIPAMRGHPPAPHIGRMDLGSARYTIRINGHLGASLLSAFPALALRRDGAHTVLTGLLDQSALFGVLAEIEALGLELIEVRQHTPERELPA